MSMVTVNTADLTGSALNWATGVAVFGEPMIWINAGAVEHVEYGNWEPSSDWSDGGPLIKKYGVLLSPPTSMVHRNFGPYDVRNGYYESGLWSTTIFGGERKHRRRGFSHPTEPLIAAMRAIVQFELGDEVLVPAELVEASP